MGKEEELKMMNTEHELFGELHEQEENGLFGNEHRRQYEAQQEALRQPAGGYYVPTKEQHDAAFKCFDELKLTPQQEEACNRVISGYSLNEKIHYDNIHIVNELKREHNF